jgi:nucleoporin NDC1
MLEYGPILLSTAVPTPSSSPSQRVKLAFSKPHTLRALSVYILTNVLISSFHIVSSHLSKTTPHGRDHFGVFVKSRYLPSTLGSSKDLSTLSFRKHPYHLSGRFLFLFMAQVTLAIGFHFRSILLDRSAVRWKHGQVCSFPIFSWRSCSAISNSIRKWSL